MKRGPKKFLSKTGVGKKKRRKQKQYQQQQRRQQEAIKQAAQARFGSTHLRPIFGSAKKNSKRASARFRNPRRKKASVSETLEGQASPNFIFFNFIFSQFLSKF
jgi:hypothetical protein